MSSQPKNGKTTAEDILVSSFIVLFLCFLWAVYVSGYLSWFRGPHEHPSWPEYSTIVPDITTLITPSPVNIQIVNRYEPPDRFQHGSSYGHHFLQIWSWNPPSLTRKSARRLDRSPPPRNSDVQQNGQGLQRTELNHYALPPVWRKIAEEREMTDERRAWRGVCRLSLPETSRRDIATNPSYGSHLVDHVQKFIGYDCRLTLQKRQVFWAWTGVYWMDQVKLERDRFQCGTGHSVLRKIEQQVWKELRANMNHLLVPGIVHDVKYLCPLIHPVHTCTPHIHLPCTEMKFVDNICHNLAAQ